ncbi:hypothetical protein [Caballeronia temeraria]|uniref:hypothetical protein n=1 Tax=Caballeronia temeraria TaxID=1777137 RepID=UPI0007725E64|nr:hypothetical protein [Caballeronia temeraria]
MRRLLELWQHSAAVIGTGLLGSFLTCLVGTFVNAIFDTDVHALEAATFVRRLSLGYIGAAVVVVVAFPFMANRRRLISDDS